MQLARERAAAAATAAKERASGKVAGSDAAGIAAFTDSVDAFVKANADRFPVTNALNNGRAVAEFIVSEFARTRRLMPVEEAARFLERHYFNESKRLHDQFRPVAHLLDAEEGPAADLSDARPIDDRERLRRARAILDASLRKKKR